MQICAGLTSAAYLREHNCESVLRTRQIVPGTAWVVPQKPASVVLLLRLSPIAFSCYGSRFVQAILCSF